MAIQISSSSLKAFQTCPFSFSLGYIQRMKPQTKHILAQFGSALHYTICLFYRPLSNKAKKKRISRGEPLIFPKTQESAVSLWLKVWREALKEENANKKIFPFACNLRYDGKTEKEIRDERRRYTAWGIQIIKKYWEIHRKMPLPVAVEQKFSVPAPQIIEDEKGNKKVVERFDVLLIGSIDQIIKGSNGSFWLVDLKTGIGSEIWTWRDQYPFHHDYQFTTYSWAFRHMFPGNIEAGIIIYPLNIKTNEFTGEIREREVIVTTREESDYCDLAEFIQFFLWCQKLGIFPRHFGPHCRNCDFLEFCDRGEKKVVTPVSIRDINGEFDISKIKAEIQESLKTPHFSQPRLKF